MDPQVVAPAPETQVVTPPPSTHQKWPVILGAIIVLLAVGTGGIFLGQRMSKPTLVPTPTPTIQPTPQASSPDCSLNSHTADSVDGKWLIYASPTCDYSFSYPKAWYFDSYSPNEANSIIVGDIAKPAGADPDAMEGHTTLLISMYPGMADSTFPYTNGSSENTTIKPYSVNGYSGVRGQSTSAMGLTQVVNLQGPENTWISLVWTGGNIKLFDQILSTFKFSSTSPTPTSRPVTTPPLLDTSTWKSGSIANVTFKYPPDYTTRVSDNAIELITPPTQYGSTTIGIGVYTYNGGSRREWFVNHLHEVSQESVASIQKYIWPQEVKLGTVDALDMYQDGGWWQGGYTSPTIIASGRTIVTLTPSGGRYYDPQTGKADRYQILDTIGSTIKFN